MSRTCYLVDDEGDDDDDDGGGVDKRAEQDIRIRSAGGCFPVLDHDVAIVSSALLKCTGEVVLDSLKFTFARQLNDEVSFEDVLLAIRRDRRLLARIVAKLSALDGRDITSAQPDNKKQISSSQTRVQRAFAAVGVLHPEAFASASASGGLLYGRLLRSAAPDDAYRHGDDSSLSSKATTNFCSDVRSPAMRTWLSKLTGGIPVSDAAFELLAFCLYEFLQQISDIAALLVTTTQRRELSTTSTLCYTAPHRNILPEATRRFLEGRSFLCRT